MPIKAPDIPIPEYEGLDIRTRWELMVAEVKRGVTSGEREGRAEPPTRAWAVTSLLRKLASTQTRFADLHVHTRISDGWISPGDAVERAARVGLAAVAIADHDSISGIQAALWAGQQY
ncbi:MAG: PHP domain-containing protein, partial [Hadesarchaea archaeon]|nr:PHP domain-containing protein [Hadesarchaea archaeon]